MSKRYRTKSVGNLSRVKGWKALAKSLKLKSMGLTVASFPAGEGYDHAHCHALQEEVYVLLSGRGEMIVDGKRLRLRPGDVVAADPPALRALRSGPRSSSTWLIVSAVPGTFRDDDWTEYDDPAFPKLPRRKSRRPTRSRRSN